MINADRCDKDHDHRQHGKDDQFFLDHAYGLFEPVEGRHVAHDLQDPDHLHQPEGSRRLQINTGCQPERYNGEQVNQAKKAEYVTKRIFCGPDAEAIFYGENDNNHQFHRLQYGQRR